jgi:hypothetical protein
MAAGSTLGAFASWTGTPAGAGGATYIGGITAGARLPAPFAAGVGGAFSTTGGGDAAGVAWAGGFSRWTTTTAVKATNELATTRPSFVSRVMSRSSSAQRSEGQ